jgi:DNA-binding transcriptional LysR family regulator
MKQPTLLAMDFAALRTLRLLYENRSFTETAAVLGINQSAVSYTIEKLRRAFNDPLFFRQGGKVVPTERCGIIVSSVMRMLDEIEALAAPVSFDPFAAELNVSIACNYYERQIILPGVVKALREKAPGIRIAALNSTTQGAQLLKRSDADLLIGPLHPDGHEFYSRSLLGERYVCVMDKANPLGEQPLGLEPYVAAPHATVTYGGTWRSRYLVQLDSLGMKLNTVLEVPSPAGLEKVISGTDLIATVPGRIARTYGDAVKIVESPCPAPFEVYLVWTTRTHKSAMHDWLRKLILECVKDQQNASGVL